MFVSAKQYRDYLLTESDLHLRKVDQRNTDRWPLDGPLAYPLLGSDRETPIKKIRPLDVSNRGLGFLCEQYLTPGDFLWLDLGTGLLALEVVYCESYLGLDHLFRCGLFMRDADKCLKDILRPAD